MDPILILLLVAPFLGAVVCGLLPRGQKAVAIRLRRGDGGTRPSARCSELWLGLGTARGHAALAP